MRNRNTKIRVGILSIGALTLFGFFSFDLWRLNRENAETALLLIEHAETESAESAVGIARSLRASAPEELTAFDSLTLNETRLVPLIESIEGAGRALDLELEIVSVEKKDEGEGSPQLIRIAIEASGDWKGVYSLLSATESLPYRVMIENTTLSKQEEGWRGDFVISLHSFR